jgi:peptidoglycan/LPS O-acetylase OafA/YrhL
VHILLLLVWVFFFVGGFQYVDIESFVINALLLQGWVPDVKVYWGFNAVSWSISCELFFYVSFLFLVKLSVKQQVLLISVLLLIIFTLNVFLYGEVYFWIFYINPVSRLVEFLSGILVFRGYVFINERGGVTKSAATQLELGSICAIVLFVGVAILGDVGKNFRFSLYYLIPMVFMVFAFSFDKGVVSRLLSSRVIVYLGESSFCLYMVHLMFLGYVVPRFFIPLDKNSMLSVVTVLAIMVAFVVPLSCLLHTFFEKPMNLYLRRALIRGYRSYRGLSSFS